MVKRYGFLYAELKILEYQLKKKARQVGGEEAGYKIRKGRRGFVKPEIFEKIIKEK